MTEDCDSLRRIAGADGDSNNVSMRRLVKAFQNAGVEASSSCGSHSEPPVIAFVRALLKVEADDFRLVNATRKCFHIL